jgi:putative colanic acid biosynthesis acetyltransferase WcaF
MNPKGRQLEEFVPNFRKQKLNSRIPLISWYLIFNPLVASRWNISIIRIWILRRFGATVGKNVKIRSGISVHIPKNLEIGNFSWIGERAWFINHAKISIGSNVCISQRSIICSGGHDYRSASLEYAHRPIEIKDGAWICLDAKVLPGVTIGECSVISAGEIVRKSIPDYSILVGGEIRPIDPPK